MGQPQKAGACLHVTGASSEQGRRDDNHRARYMRQVTARENSPISNRHQIHCPELETKLTCTKHPLQLISNRQFFALLKLPDRSLNSALRKRQKQIPHTAKVRPDSE